MMRRSGLRLGPSLRAFSSVGDQSARERAIAAAQDTVKAGFDGLEHAARGDISALMTDTARVADGLARGLNETAKFALDTVSGGQPGGGDAAERDSDFDARVASEQNVTDDGAAVYRSYPAGANGWTDDGFVPGPASRAGAGAAAPPQYGGGPHPTGYVGTTAGMGVGGSGLEGFIPEESGEKARELGEEIGADELASIGSPDAVDQVPGGAIPLPSGEPEGKSPTS